MCPIMGSWIIKVVVVVLEIKKKRSLAAQSRGMFKPSSCKSYGYAVFGALLKVSM